MPAPSTAGVAITDGCCENEKCCGAITATPYTSAVTQPTARQSWRLEEAPPCPGAALPTTQRRTTWLRDCEMPGRAPRSGEQRLTGKQSREAGKYLRDRWTPETVWSVEEKAELAAAINARFIAQGEPAMYSVRKLDDWLSNARYRANCKQRAKEPESWSLERRAEARQKSRKQNRSEQQKQRRDQTAAKLRAVPITKAVPLVGWAAAPRVQDIVMQFEAPAEVKQPADAGFGWPDASQGRPRSRSQEFKAIRDGFERQRIGRTDMWASHRGYSSAPTAQGTSGGPLARDPAHFFEGQLNGGQTTKASDELVPTFLSVRGLPLPPVVDLDDDAMQSSPEAKPEVHGTMPEPLHLGAGILQQDFDLDLDASMDDLTIDFDLDMQGLPVVEGQLHHPVDRLLDADASAMSYDSSTQSGAAAAGWLSDYASQSTGMLSSLVDDNIDSDRALPETDVGGGWTPSCPGVDNMSLDTRPLRPLPPKSTALGTASAAATAVKTARPALPTAVASTVTATAVEIDLLAAPGFLDSDLATLLPAFDEGEAAACLPAPGWGKTDYYTAVQVTHPSERQEAALHSGGYHAHTLQAAHAIIC